uniref:Uncharacterized protein n=1 Tax=Rhipicephalus zambeziensis TaxID=60191 RepID=A0A224YFR6_9ACAR
MCPTCRMRGAAIFELVSSQLVHGLKKNKVANYYLKFSLLRECFLKSLRCRERANECIELDGSSPGTPDFFVVMRISFLTAFVIEEFNCISI